MSNWTQTWTQFTTSATPSAARHCTLRGTTSTARATGGRSVNSAEAKSTKSPVTDATSPVDVMLRRAVAGDTAALPELRAALQQPEVVEVLGNLARRIEVQHVEKLAGKDLALREALTLKLEAMREE